MIRASFIPPIKVEEISQRVKDLTKKDYFLIVSRVVGAKGIDMAIEAANKLKLPLKIVGETAGLRWEEKKFRQLQGKTVEFVGRKTDAELWQLYGQAKAFLALASDEDFGMTVVEAQAAGTPVLAYYGGGYKETILPGETGEFFYKYNQTSLETALTNFNSQKYDQKKLQAQAKKFSQERFIKEITQIVGTS